MRQYDAKMVKIKKTVLVTDYNHNAFTNHNTNNNQWILTIGVRDNDNVNRIIDTLVIAKGITLPTLLMKIIMMIMSLEIIQFIL